MNESAVYEIRLKDSFSSPLKGLEPKMNRFEGKVEGLKSSFDGLGSSIAGAFAGGLVAGGIASLLAGMKDVVTETVNIAREFTNLKEAIEFASGTEAATNIKFLDDTIKTLGLDMKSTYTGFKTFQGALMGTILEGEEGRKIFTAVSKASSVMKLSAESTEGAFLALGQMISKGTVSAEELRGQLGERLPGAFQIAARAMGVTTAKLGDMMKAGEVAAEDFLPKFALVLEKTFGPGVLKAQDSFNANMNRFNNWILKAKISLGNSLIPAINDFVSILPKLDFTAITFSWTQMTDTIGNSLSVFNDLFKSLGFVTDAMSGFQIVVQYMGLALRISLTPLRLLIVAFDTIVQGIKAASLAMVEFFKLGANVVTGDFKAAGINVDNIKNIGANFGEAFGKSIDKEIEGWKNIFKLPGETDQKGTAGAGVSGVGGLSKQKSGKTGEGSGVEKITAGTRNITININKLVESVNISKTFGRNNESELVDAVKRALLTGVNDVNIMAQ